MPPSRWSAFQFLLLSACLVPVPLLAGTRIEGEVVNGTTNRPAAGQTVVLLMPRGGMAQVAATKADSRGHFVLTGADLNPNDFYLLQASRQGVDYHAPVQFDPNGIARVDFQVYDSTNSPPQLRIKSARVIVKVEGQSARVQELFAVENTLDPPRSYGNPEGTFHFRLSPAASTPTAAVAGKLNMPLRQTPEPGGAPGEFFLKYPLQPGMTVVMVAYEADYASERLELADSVPYPIAQVELDTSPPTLMVASSLFQPAGDDPDTGGRRLQATSLASGATLSAEISGEAEETVQVVPNSMTRLAFPLMGCFLLVLLWAMGVRVAREWQRSDSEKPTSAAQKRLRMKLENLLNSLADLDELFASGKIPEKNYWRERLDLKAKLVAVLKKGPPSFFESYAARHLSH